VKITMQSKSAEYSWLTYMLNTLMY